MSIKDYLKQLFLFLFLFLSSSFGLAIQPTTDTIISSNSLFVLPYASYQQETSLAPGFAGGYYFKSKDVSRISSISGSAIYTFRNQFLLNVAPKIYFNNGKWFLYSNLSIRNYPDYYFGIGNEPNNTKQSFTSQNTTLLLQPQYIISKCLFVGGLFSIRSESVLTDTTFKSNKASIYNQFGSSGWNPFFQLNVGFVVAYDSRDNQFYPQQGTFAKAAFSISKAGWGSTYSLQELTFDFRCYLPLFATHVLATQVYYAGTFGGSGIPFQVLPTLGGCDLMRGFRQGMYRDNILMFLQSEYRLPIYKRLKAALFCAAGDVMNNSDYRIDKLKVAYGAGLRYRLNDARAHLRLDFAKNNYGDELQFYLTVTEAF